MQGIFITMEGPDGAGKTTQIELLKDYLNKKGYDVLITRDPGGNAVSEAIREVILNKDFTEMGYRFVDSSAVYQGIGRGLGIDTVYKVNEFALQGILPDMTFLMDLDAEAGIARKKNQAELDRMEQESLEFHKKVVEGYRCLAEMNPDRIVKVDAALPKEVIHDIIISYVEKWLARP